MTFHPPQMLSNPTALILLSMAASDMPSLPGVHPLKTKTINYDPSKFFPPVLSERFLFQERLIGVAALSGFHLLKEGKWDRMERI